MKPNLLLRQGWVAALCGLLSFASAAHAEGWKFWATKSDPARADGTIGGAPSMSPAQATSGSSWSLSTSVAKINAWNKRCWNKTVDVVTLKSLRTPKPPQKNVQLGFHPDPRKQAPKSPGMLGSLFSPKKTSGEPQTVGEFFSQPRP